MAFFVEPVAPHQRLQSGTASLDIRNPPINFDQVLTLRSSFEAVDLNSDTAGVAPRRESFPAIRFTTPGAEHFCWLFSNTFDRDEELGRLRKLVIRYSRP